MASISLIFQCYLATSLNIFCLKERSKNFGCLRTNSVVLKELRNEQIMDIESFISLENCSHQTYHLNTHKISKKKLNYFSSLKFKQ